MRRQASKKRSPRKFAVLNGPNLNLLGLRDPSVYGKVTLQSIDKRLKKIAANAKVSIWLVQSNSEGALVDAIHKAIASCDGIIINPAAYTHTSVAIHDALECATIPVIEVHLSNIFARETFRRHSYVSPVASGIITGLGAEGYEIALQALIQDLVKRPG